MFPAMFSAFRLRVRVLPSPSSAEGGRSTDFACPLINAGNGRESSRSSALAASSSRTSSPMWSAVTSPTRSRRGRFQFSRQRKIRLKPSTRRQRDRGGIEHPSSGQRDASDHGGGGAEAGASADASDRHSAGAGARDRDRTRANAAAAGAATSGADRHGGSGHRHGTLKIQGETIELAGIKGLGSPYRDQLAKFIQEQGSQIRCEPISERYVCFVSNVDLGLAALTNGAARPAADATPQYRQAADEARRNRRGIFQ